MKNKQFMQRICNTFIFDNINFLQCTIGWFRRQADLEGRAFTVKDLPFTPLAPLGRGLGRGAYQTEDRRSGRQADLEGKKVGR